MDRTNRKSDSLSNQLMENLMKKIILILMIFICPFYTFATSEDEMAKAYREGREAAEDGIRNQQMWEKGEGNPEMAKTYQEGKKFALERVKKQKDWEKTAQNKNMGISQNLP